MSSRAVEADAQASVGQGTGKTIQKRKGLPCGARTCLHCHRGCGVETAAYILRGLEDLDEAAEAKAAE